MGHYANQVWLYSLKTAREKLWEDTDMWQPWVYTKSNASRPKWHDGTEIQASDDNAQITEYSVKNVGTTTVHDRFNSMVLEESYIWNWTWTSPYN